MSTQQPMWKCVGHIGDVDPIAHGGGFVYVDETGVYPPEMSWFEPAPDEDWHKTEGATPLKAYRIVLDPPRFKTLTEKGKRLCFGTKELPSNQRGDTWYWYPEWYVKDLSSVASSAGTTQFALLRGLFSRDAMKRAFAYWAILGHYGAYEFDQYPVTCTEDEAYAEYADEMKKARAA